MARGEMTASYSDTEDPEQAGSSGAYFKCNMRTWKMAAVMASMDTRLDMQVKADVDVVVVSNPKSKQVGACLLA